MLMEPLPISPIYSSTNPHVGLWYLNPPEQREVLEEFSIWVNTLCKDEQQLLTGSVYNTTGAGKTKV